MAAAPGGPRRRGGPLSPHRPVRPVRADDRDGIRPDPVPGNGAFAQANAPLLAVRDRNRDDRAARADLFLLLHEGETAARALLSPLSARERGDDRGSPERRSHHVLHHVGDHERGHVPVDRTGAGAGPSGRDEVHPVLDRGINSDAARDRQLIHHLRDSEYRCPFRRDVRRQRRIRAFDPGAAFGGVRDQERGMAVSCLASRRVR